MRAAARSECHRPSTTYTYRKGSYLADFAALRATQIADRLARMSSALAGPSELSQAAPSRVPVGALPLAVPARALLGLRGLNNLGNTCAASTAGARS